MSWRINKTNYPKLKYHSDQQAWISPDFDQFWAQVEEKPNLQK